MGGVVVNLIQQRSRLINKSESVAEATRRGVDRGAAGQDTEPVCRLIGSRQSFAEPDSRFVHGAFAPVTERQIGLSFGNLLLIAERFKNPDAFADQVLGQALRARR